MKKILLLLLALVLSFTTASAKKSPAERAAGTYSGLLYIGMGTPVTPETESTAANITLEVQSANTVKFTLPNFKYGSLTLGDIVLNNIPVSEDENGRIIFGHNDPQTVSVSIISANVYIDDATSYIEDDYASVDVNVSTRVVFSDVTIYVRFQGNNSDYQAAGVADAMEGTRTGTTYSAHDEEVSSTSRNSATKISVTAVDANTINLLMHGAQALGVELGDVTFSNIAVSKNADGTVSLADATTTGSIAGMLDYSISLVGSKSYWSDDSIALYMQTEIADMSINLLFTTGTLPDVEEPITATDGPATEVSGTYNVAVYIGLEGPVDEATEKFTDVDINIEAETANTVRFTLKDFSLDGVNSMGDIVLTGIPVEKLEDGTFVFGANEPQTVSLAGGMLQAQVKIDENTSYVAGSDVFIDVLVDALGQTIYVHLGLPVTTGIQQVSLEGNTAPIYDLQGRRVVQPRASGVYIVGGKRVYLK